MRALPIFSTLLLLNSFLFSQNVGIGTNTPKAKLHIDNGSLLVNSPWGDISTSNIVVMPDSSNGIRLLWLAEKAAFRAQSGYEEYWKNSSIGVYSAAVGYMNKASGIGSFASGETGVASGFGAVAMGIINTASGETSVAIGNSNTASGTASVALGRENVASGYGSVALGLLNNSNQQGAVAIGVGNIAQGFNSVAMGNENHALGNSSFSTGIDNYAFGSSSVAMGTSCITSNVATIAMGEGANSNGYAGASFGIHTSASSAGSMAIGWYNDSIVGSSTSSFVETDPVFMIGIGRLLTGRKNAMTVFKNGNTDITGYTRLGTSAEAAPRIKMKKLVVTGPAVNAFSSYPIGIADEKVISASVMVKYAGEWKIPHGYNDAAGYEFYYQVQNGNVVIINKNGNSANIGSKPYIIVITYEE